jgi:hypothetical protein
MHLRHRTSRHDQIGGGSGLSDNPVSRISFSPSINADRGLGDVDIGVVKGTGKSTLSVAA